MGSRITNKSLFIVMFKNLFLKTEKEIDIIKGVISEQFVSAVGYILNLEKPKSFNEKLQWLKLNYHNPLLTICADKYRVREYVKNKIGEEYLIKIIDSYNNIAQIDIGVLPEKFVLKVNHGSGQNIICKDKNKMDWRVEKEKLKEWMNPESNHYFYSYEWCYKHIKPKIICEEFLDDFSDDVKDYKFMCFNGKSELMFVCSERNSSLKVDFFDLNWNKLPFERFYPNSTKDIKKPENFERMITLANKLAEPFPFVRVDFYEINNKIYFGEMTFYPGNGMEPFSPVEWDYKLGEYLKLT
jgi:hypothetical protein